MRRSSFFWLIGTVAFWAWMFVYDVHKAITLLIVSTIIGAVVMLALLAFHIIRARLGY